MAIFPPKFKQLMSHDLDNKCNTDTDNIKTFNNCVKDLKFCKLHILETLISNLKSENCYLKPFLSYTSHMIKTLRREGGPGSKIRFPLFFHSQIFYLRWNGYFLQNVDIFACALDIASESSDLFPNI